jgi:hypothetical protein
MGRSHDYNLVGCDWKAHQLKSWKLSRRTGSVQHEKGDGCDREQPLFPADFGFHPHVSGIAVDLKSIVVNLGNRSAIAQAEPTRSDFDPFEGRLFCPFLTFKNSVFLSVIVNEFNFVYLMSKSSHTSKHDRARMVAIRRSGENYAM